MITICNKLTRPKPSIVFNTYWKFAVKRQEVFFNRINNVYPWTKDLVLKKHKFTNAYRASDRVSQYLIKNVIYSDNQTPREILFRILLFKTFNKISTWELLQYELKEISLNSYSFAKYNDILLKALQVKESIYSGAYIMTSGKSNFGFDRKHQNHLKLIEMIIRNRIDEKVTEAKSMEEVYNILKSLPTFGSFLAYQYAIDINYSELTSFSEMDFVVPGPGARDGIRKCFSDGCISNCRNIALL